MHAVYVKRTGSPGVFR